MAGMRPQTRAYLFADLRGYSAYTERHGDRAAEELIGRYRELVREQIAAFDGAEIRTEGDSFYVVFDSVIAAVEAALSIRAAARDARDAVGRPIPIGIGIHAGESRDGEHGIVSSAVNIAARVCSRAHAGEVLVTETVRSLIRTAVPFGFRRVGRRRLKGIAEPVVLYRAESNEAADAEERRFSAPAVMGVAVAVILLVGAGLAATRGDGGSETAGTRPPSTRPADTPQPSTRETASGLSRFTDSGEFPNSGEQALLDRLLVSIRSSCDRAAADDRPYYHFDAANEGFTQPQALFVRAGISCLTQQTRVRFWQASGTQPLGTASELFFNVAQRLSIEPGDCATETKVRGEWDAGAHSGLVLCYLSGDGSAVMEWTFDEANIYAVAHRRDGDARALYAWWRDHGRLLSR